MRNFLSKFLRFKRDEGGFVTLEFAIMFPLLIGVFMSSVEMAFVTMQHSMVERSLDLTVREIRLGTGTVPQHNVIKDKICAGAPLVKNCSTSLKLEMVPLNLRAWAAPNSTADCTDVQTPAKPVRAFVAGNKNELMLLRACVKYQPIMPNFGLGLAMRKDGSGYAAIVSMSAFVQEP